MACTEPDRHLIIRRYLNWLKFVQVVFVSSPTFQLHNWSDEYSTWISPRTGSGSWGSSSVFSGVITVKGDDRTGDITMVEAQTPLANCWTCSWDLPIPFVKLFLVKSLEDYWQTTLLKCLITQFSGLSGGRWWGLLYIQLKYCTQVLIIYTANIQSD
jgi:hypothetical protein